MNFMIKISLVIALNLIDSANCFAKAIIFQFTYGYLQGFWFRTPCILFLMKLIWQILQELHKAIWSCLSQLLSLDLILFEMPTSFLALQIRWISIELDLPRFPFLCLLFSLRTLNFNALKEFVRQTVIISLIKRIIK